MKFSNVILGLIAFAIAGIAGFIYLQKQSAENITGAPAAAEAQIASIEPAAAPDKLAVVQPAPAGTPATTPAIPTTVAQQKSAQEASQPLASAIAESRAIQKAQANVSYVYERPVMTKFSQVYWTLGKFDTAEDMDIDNYLMINECDIYKDYYHNEFEWRTVRDAARNFLKENKDKFSLRFEVMQPLRLGEYHMDTSSFDIVKEYQIKNTRRFEVYAYDYQVPICNWDIGGQVRPIMHYPRGLLIELTRPIMLTDLPVNKVTANNFIEEKLRAFNQLPAQYKNQSNLFNARDAYVMMKVKLFAYRGESFGSGGPLAEVLGILEGIEIYSDRKKKRLLYVEDYRRKKQGIKADPALNIDTLRSPVLSDDPPELRQPVKVRPANAG